MGQIARGERKPVRGKGLEIKKTLEKIVITMEHFLIKQFANYSYLCPKKLKFIYHLKKQLICSQW